MFANLYFVLICGVISFFIIFCIVSGLLYLTDLIERNCVGCKKFFCLLPDFTIIVLLLFWLFEGYPFLEVVFSMGFNLVYRQYFYKFPYINIASPLVFFCAIAAIMNNFMWYRYFLVFQKIPAVHLIGFFTGAVWFTPLALLLSLSATELTLPTRSDSHEQLFIQKSLFRKVCSYLGFPINNTQM